MFAPKSLQFFGDEAVSALPYGDMMPGLSRHAEPCADETDEEQPMVVVVEVLWAAIALAAACATAMFLAG